MHELIYDWNTVEAPPAAPQAPVMLDDETLRDGLQSPSVRTPAIDQKIEILHLIDALGIDTADIGLPGAGPHVARDVERLSEAGWVEKRPDPDDRRVVRLFTTPKAEGRKAELIALRTQANAELLAVFSPEEQVLLKRFLWDLMPS